MFDGSMKVSLFILRLFVGFAAEYGVSFTGACLAIGKKCGIVAVEDRVDEVGGFVVDLLLGFVLEHMVKLECFLLIVFPLDSE